MNMDMRGKKRIRRTMAMLLTLTMLLEPVGAAVTVRAAESGKENIMLQEESGAQQADGAEDMMETQGDEKVQPAETDAAESGTEDNAWEAETGNGAGETGEKLAREDDTDVTLSEDHPGDDEAGTLDAEDMVDDSKEEEAVSAEENDANESDNEADAETAEDIEEVDEFDAEEESVEEISVDMTEPLDGEDIIDSGTSGGINWVVDASGKLTISGTGNLPKSGNYFEPPWGKAFSSTTSKIKTAKLTVIGMTDASDLFKGCYNLEEVDFSDFDSGEVTNISYLFSGCSALENVDLSDLDTSKVTDMSYLFDRCKNLKNIQFGNKFNTEKVTNMAGMFSGCRLLETIDLSAFNTSNVTDMSAMFSTCLELQTLDLSGFHTEKVTDMHWMFSDCWRLSGLNLNSFNTSNVTNMEGMFAECRLDNFVLGALDTANVTNMSFMFYHDPAEVVSGFSEAKKTWGTLDWNKLGIKKLDLGSVEKRDAEKGTWGGTHGIFAGRDLSTLDLKKLDTSKTTTLSGLFVGCDVTGLDFSELDSDHITDMSYMFNHSSGTPDFSALDSSNATDMSYMLGAYAQVGFSWRYVARGEFVSLDLSGLDTHNATDMTGMFRGLENITSLDMSNLDTGNVTCMREMFAVMHNLTSLNLQGLDTGKVTNVGDMFAGCESLETLDLSVLDTRSVTTTFGMVANCPALKSINLTGLDLRQVTDMSEMFWQSYSLESIDFSSCKFSKIDMLPVSKFPFRLIFGDCKGLKTLDMSSIDFEKQTVSLWLGDCTSLEEFRTPINIKVSIELPKASDSDKWYDTEGNEITELPQNLPYSTTVCKNKKPAVTDASIRVTKAKVKYLYGDSLTTDDITVIYNDGKGNTRVVTDFKVDASGVNMSAPGAYDIAVTYTEASGKVLSASVTVYVTYPLQESEVGITLPEDWTSYQYSAFAITPVPTAVTLTMAGKEPKALEAEKDYTLTYSNNINAGNNAKMILTGQGAFSGTIEKTFSIAPAKVTIAAGNYTIMLGDPLPDDYPYIVKGLLGDDKLKKAPSFDFSGIDTTVAGRYTVTPRDADAGSNYTIDAYQPGILTVSKEKVAYTVSFDLMGHGSGMASVGGIASGSLLERPEDPSADGWIFGGWYQDQNCTKAWDFETDAVQRDITLYARWIAATAGEGKPGAQISVQDIGMQIYTGSALKPAVAVYAADGITLLNVKKDYTITYYNNIEADTAEEELLPGGTNGSGTDGENGFSKNLAYVMITGKGNYTGTIYRNFHIGRCSISDGMEADGTDNGAAPGVTFKYADQIVKSSSKVQKPFQSLKYKKALVAGTDMTITLTAVDACDEKGAAIAKGTDVGGSTTAPVIPKGYYGTFRLTVRGIGNYKGVIAKTIFVGDQSALLKNASISLGKKIKSVSYTGGEITLSPGVYDPKTKKYKKVSVSGAIGGQVNGDTVFTVKAGGNYLVYGKDYTVSYQNNIAVGTATMTVTGIGAYTGSKTATFKITGTAFNAKNISADVSDMTYTGKTLTQNSAALTVAKDGLKIKGETLAKGTLLTYGRDYTISYKNNLKKGKAEMMFTARPESGWSGSFTMKFSIGQASFGGADIIAVYSRAADGTEIPVTKDSNGVYHLTETVAYAKEGAKPAQIILRNMATGSVLKEGADYTIGYSDNKNVTDGSGRTPYMTLKGKGNYKDNIRVEFKIDKAPLTREGIRVNAAVLAFDERKASIEPVITVKDGKATLKRGTDYEVDYCNCSKEAVQAYLAYLEGTGAAVPAPCAELKGMNCYKAEIYTVPLTIYRYKLAKDTLYILPDQASCTYTGQQVKAGTAVYYGTKEAVKKAVKDQEMDEAKLVSQSGDYKLKKLSPGTDYTLSYGANVAAGKNKGTVTVTGRGLYGGSVTAKFTIVGKNIYF